MVKKQNQFIIPGLVIFGVLASFSIFIATANSQEQGQNLDTARIQKFEMIDSETGNIYCLWIKNGQWQQVKASCDSDAAQNMFGEAPGWSGQQIQQFSGSTNSQTSQSQYSTLKAQIEKDLAQEIKKEVQSQIQSQQQNALPQIQEEPQTQEGLQAPEQLQSELPTEGQQVQQEEPIIQETPVEEQAPAQEIQEAPAENPEPASEPEPLSFRGIISKTTAGLVNSVSKFVGFVLSSFKMIGNIFNKY